MERVISTIIENNGLSAGQPMKNIHGDDIPDSVVLDNYTYALKNEDGRYLIEAEGAVSGERSNISLGLAAFAALKTLG